MSAFLKTFLKRISRETWIAWLAGILFFLPLSLLAQNTYLVNDNAGDDSPGSLGAAVTGLNASDAAGAITFEESLPITLSLPFTPLSQAVTFQGSSVQIEGQNDAQSQFDFQQNFIQQVQYLTLENNGGLGTDLDVSVTAAGWAMDPDDDLFLYGATAPSTQTSSSGVTGQAGGNVQMVIGGTWNTGDNSLIQINAGAGGSVSDGLGYQDQGGNGGSVSLSFDTLNFTGSYLLVNAGTGGAVSNTNGMGNLGGNGGSVVVQGNNCSLGGDGVQFTAGSGGGVTDLGTGTPQGGNGGSVDFTIYNELSVSSLGNVILQGGQGGAGVTGGTGGGADLETGSVTLSTILVVQGGTGGSGVSLSGAGGDASVNIGSINQSSEYLEVLGGNGGPSNYLTGQGGNVQVWGGMVTLSGSAELLATAGAGGDSYVSGSGGNGGSAGVSLGVLSITGSGAGFKVSAGTGGLGSQGTFTGDGGNGGDLAVTLGTLSMNGGSALTLTGGTGGAGGSGSGNPGGAGGNGGNVSLYAGSASLTSVDVLDITGGSGGLGGSGSTSGSNGAQGQALVSIGDLESQGAISINGSNALLEVSSGAIGIAGPLEGNVTLEKIGSGNLALSSVCSYTGGTTVVNGQLNVEGVGKPGTGTVVVLDGALLGYLTSSIVQNTILNYSDLVFLDSSSAGSATIVNNSGLVYFYDDSTGDNAQLINNGTGVVDFSGSDASTVAGGAMTIGSIAGGGVYDLGRVDLFTGGNDLSTTVSGSINDGGASGGGTGASLTKIGTGTLTLTGANTYSGGTVLDSGALAFGNSQALGLGSVSVNDGTLESAGYPVGLVIGGNYSQTSQGTLKLGLGGSQAAYYDTVSVIGNVTLGGTLNLYSYGGLSAPALGSSLVALSSSGTLTGTFQQVEESLGDIRLLPLYYNNGVELESIIPSFVAASLTSNQKAIGADLDTNVFNPQLMGMMSQLGALSGSSLQAAENEVSPAGLSALFQAGFAGAASRAALVDQRLWELRDAQPPRFSLPGYSNSDTPLFAGNLTPVEEASMATQREGDWSGFVSGNGGILNVSGNANAAGYQVTTYGLTGAGADVRLSPDFALGLMAGFGQSNITLDGGGTLSAGGGDFGLYGLFTSYGFYADGLVEGGINQYNTLRQSYEGVASGQTQGSEWSGAMELGYGWKVRNLTLGPVASLQYTRVGLNGFTEMGSVTPLTYPAQSQDSLVSRLGLQAGGHWKLGDTVVSPELTLSWEHEYDDQGGIVEAGFGAGDSFTVAGPPLDPDGLLVEAGLNMAFTKNFSADLNYQGEVARVNWSSNQAGGGIRLGF